MKIASGILSLILGAMILFQSCAVTLGGSIFNEESAAQGGSVGLMVGMLFLIGGAFSFALPKVSMCIMLIAGFFGIAAGNTTVYSDLKIWGVVALILAVLNYFGSRKKAPQNSTPSPPAP